MRHLGLYGMLGKTPMTTVWRCRGKVDNAAPSCATLRSPARCYFWPYNEDFVPKGVTTSGFQSSTSPNVRQRVLQEYALSPLFGARVPCCTLGTMRHAKEMVVLKKDIQSLLCDILHLRDGTITLGPLVQATDMLLFKHGTPLSPKLGDDRRSNMHAYGRKPVVARTLMDVFLPEDIALNEVLALGQLVQEKLRVIHNKEAFLDHSSGSEFAGSSASGSGREEDPVWVLVRRVGISHCDVPPLDESGFTFDAVGGTPLDTDEAERIMQRWHERGC